MQLATVKVSGLRLNASMAMVHGWLPQVQMPIEKASC